MNKSELVDSISHELKLSLRESSSIMDTIINAMTESLADGDNIEIRGFGSFTVKKYESYCGRNPKTGQKINVSPKKLPFFKVGKELKERVNR
ncbi:MAG: integration host factor subunit beta [Deltaproteobacteria bacterium]|nr:integration host factor subunit beta [Deltaproteobacteria bacterium]